MNNNDPKNTLLQNARTQSFTQPIQNQYVFKRMETDPFWDVYTNNFHQHAPLDLFFEEEKLRSHHEIENLKIVNDPERLLEDNYLLLDKSENVIAMMRGWQKNYDSYYMQFTAVHSKYRQSGIYSELIDRVLNYTKILGFSRILSCHAPFNNAVLIAKLKKDFKIISMELDPLLGPNIWLCYFHNEELKRAYEFRCGKLVFSEQLRLSSLGTVENLESIIHKR